MHTANIPRREFRRMTFLLAPLGLIVALAVCLACLGHCFTAALVLFVLYLEAIGLWVMAAQRVEMD